MANQHVVAKSDWATVVGYLYELNDSQIKILGGLLGLSAASVGHMKDLPREMVEAWLKGQENVVEVCGPGKTPTWEILAQKLEEMKPAQTHTAKTILQEKCQQGGSSKKLDDLLSDCSLSKSNLKNCKCSSRDIEVLSKSIKDWRAFANHFKLTEDIIKRIQDHPEKSFDHCTTCTVRNKLVLQNWVDKVGERNANFLTLAEACCELHHWNIVEDFIVIECKKQTAIKARATAVKLTDHLAGTQLLGTGHVELKAAFSEQRDVSSESEFPASPVASCEPETLRRVNPSESSGESETKIPTSNTAAPIYFLCRCKSERDRCTYQDYINGRCSGHMKDIFPYLNAKGLSQNEKRRLTDKLCDDTKQVIDEFGRTVIGIFQILNEKQVSLGEIMFHVAAYSTQVKGHRQIVSALRTAKNIHDLGLLLLEHKLISFLNYRILEAIVEESEKQLKDGSLRSQLDKYLVSFKEFCKRSVFEVPVRTFKDCSPECDTKFVVKVSQDYFSESVVDQGTSFQTQRIRDSEFTLQHLFEVRCNIQKIIGQRDSIIDFVCGVEKGCVEISFCLLSTVDSEVLPFSTGQLRELLQIGVKVLYPNKHKTTEFDKGNGRDSAPSEDSQLATTEADFDGSQFLIHCMLKEWDMVDALLDSATGPIPFEQQQSDESSGKNAFHYTCASGNLERVKAMISKGADVAHVDKDGLSVLHYKEVLNNKELLTLLLNQFLEKGKSVDLASNQHYTPLLQAINDYGEAAYPAVELLLKYGASPDGNSQAHSRPLTLACELGSLKLVKLLLGFGADLNAQDKDYNTPLLVACKKSRWEVVRYLLDQHDIKTNLSDGSGTTPLFECITKCQYEFVERLLDLGAPTNCKRHRSNPLREMGSGEETPLAHACALGLIRYAQILIDHRADINFRCWGTVSPIGFAIINRKNEMVEFLLTQPTLDKSLDGLTGPIVISVKVENFECTKMILDSLGGAEQALTKAHNYGMSDLKEHIRIFLAFNLQGFTEQEDVGSESDSLRSSESSVGLTCLSVSGAQVGTGPAEAGHSESKISTSNKTPIYFQCRCNSEHGCTYDDYINGKCSGHMNDIFPYLNAEDLSPKEKRQLVDKLCDDTKQIMEEFGQTAIDIFEILDTKKVSLDAIRIQVTAFSVGKSERMYSDLHEAKTIQALGSRLLEHKFISFLNYRILEKIVEHFEKQFKDGILRNRLSEYLVLFEVFSKRSVFEVPVRTFKDNSPESDTKFVVKVSKDYFGEKVPCQEATFQAEGNHESDFEFTMRHLFDVRRNIQRIIGLRDSIIDFVCGVGKGCVEITFSLLSSVDPEVLPFSTEQVKQLLQIGIRVIHENPSKLTTKTPIHTIDEDTINSLSTKFMDRAQPEIGDRERLYTNLLKQENSECWNTIRLRELTGCAGETDEKFAGVRRSLTLSRNIYLQLKDSDIWSLVQQLDVLMPGMFSRYDIEFFQQDNSTSPKLPQIKYREFSSRLQTLSARPSSASKLVENLYLSFMNLYEHASDMTMDVYYNYAYLLRIDVLKQLGKEDTYKREQDLKAIVANIPEEDFDEDKAKQLVDILDIKLTVRRFNSYRKIAFQWLEEKGSECKLITLVLALMKSHLGRVMSKLLPICSSNPPGVKHYMLNLPLESLNGVIAFLGYTQDCVEIRALENACIHAASHLKAKMFLRICQFPDCLRDGDKIVQCLKEVDAGLKKQVVLRSSSVSGSELTSSTQSAAGNVPSHYAQTPPTSKDNMVQSTPTNQRAISSPSPAHVKSVWQQQGEEYQSKKAPQSRGVLLQEGKYIPTARLVTEQQSSAQTDVLQAVGKNRETSSTTSLDSLTETDFPRHPLPHESPAAMKKTLPVMHLPQRVEISGSPDHPATSADSQLTIDEDNINSLSTKFMDREQQAEIGDQEKLYTNLLQQENSECWNTIRLKELAGCIGETDEKFAGVRRYLTLPRNIYLQLKDSDVWSLVQQLDVLMPGMFSQYDIEFFQQDNSTSPKLRQAKYGELSSRLQRLSAMPSSASKIVENLYLSLRNLYEQASDMTMDGHYNLAYSLRTDVLKQLGKEDTIKREQDLKAIVVNIPEEDFDEDKAKQLVKFLDIKLTARQFNSYREIAFQWLEEKGSECKLITLVLALMTSHLGRVMSKLLPICSSNPPGVKHYMLNLPLESLNGVIAFLGYTQDCVEIRALENACIHAPHLKARMFLRICQFPDCLRDGDKIVQCLKEVDAGLKKQVVLLRSSSVSGSELTSSTQSAAMHNHSHIYVQYVRTPPTSKDNMVQSTPTNQRAISSPSPAHVKSVWQQQGEEYQSKKAPQSRGVLLCIQEGKYIPTARLVTEQQSSAQTDVLQAVGKNRETSSTTSLDSLIETDFPRHPLPHESPAAMKKTQPVMQLPQRFEISGSPDNSATSADSQLKLQSLLPQPETKTETLNYNGEREKEREDQPHSLAVNAVADFDGSRFLYHCMFKEWDMVDALLNSTNGPIPIEQQQSDESSGKNAFHYICASENLERVKAMISKGADLAHVDKDRLSVLHFKEVLNNKELLTLLLNQFMEKGISVDVASNQHYTPLLQAIKFNDYGEAAYTAVELLLKYCASPDGNCQAHYRPLTLACELGSLKLVKLLLGFGADLNAQDKDYNTPLLVACKKSRWEVVRYLLDQHDIKTNLSDGSGTTPLFECITKCQYEFVERLLDLGAPTNCKRHRSNPLREMGSGEETPLAHACALGLIRYAQILIDHRADINFRCSGAVSPIGFAIFGRKNEMVEFLLTQPTLDKSLDGLTGPIVISVKVENFECTKMILDCLGGAEQALTKAHDYGLSDLQEHIQIFLACNPQSEPGVAGQLPIALHEQYSTQPRRTGAQLSRSSTSPFRQAGYLSRDYEERARSDDVLRQFCEICMNAIKKKGYLNFDVLADATRVVSMDVSNFFRRCANNTQSPLMLRADFLGASRNVSPLQFLIGQGAITCEDFVEQTILYFNGKPEEFYQALIKSFHNIPGGEDLPFDIQSVVNRLFSGQFSINCQYESRVREVPTDTRWRIYNYDPLERALRTSAAMTMPHSSDPLPIASKHTPLRPLTQEMTQQQSTSSIKYKKPPIPRNSHETQTLKSEPWRNRSQSDEAAQSTQGHPVAREQLPPTQSVPASRTTLPSTHTQQNTGLNRQARVPALPPPWFSDEVRSKPSSIKPQPPQYDSDHYASPNIGKTDSGSLHHTFKAKERLAPIPAAIINDPNQQPIMRSLSDHFKKYVLSNNSCPTPICIDSEQVVFDETPSTSNSWSSIMVSNKDRSVFDTHAKAKATVLQNPCPANLAMIPTTSHAESVFETQGFTRRSWSSYFEASDSEAESYNIGSDTYEVQTPHCVSSDCDSDPMIKSDSESFGTDSESGAADTKHAGLHVHLRTEQGYHDYTLSRLRPAFTRNPNSISAEGSHSEPERSRLWLRTSAADCVPNIVRKLALHTPKVGTAKKEIRGNLTNINFQSPCAPEESQHDTNPQASKSDPIANRWQPVCPVRIFNKAISQDIFSQQYSQQYASRKILRYMNSEDKLSDSAPISEDSTMLTSVKAQRQENGSTAAASYSLLSLPRSEATAGYHGSSLRQSSASIEDTSYCRKQTKDWAKLRPFLMDVKLKRKILGTGAYGHVRIVERNGKEYAAKVLRQSSSDEERTKIVKKYETEFAVLSNLRHRNIVGYIGVTIIARYEFPLLVMEKMEINLHRYLEQSQGLKLEQKFSILHDTGTGLDFLHTRTPVVIHRDLSAKNVLLDSNLVAKIADFGNSSITDLDPSEKSRTMTDQPGTLVYTAPEALKQRAHYGPQIDIFSFGHLAIFTINQEFPSYLKEPNYQKKRNGPLYGRTEVQRRAEYIEKLYEILPKEHGVVRLIKKCLHNDPGRRPTTSDILYTLERALEQLQRERTQENESTIQ